MAKYLDARGVHTLWTQIKANFTSHQYVDEAIAAIPVKTQVSELNNDIGYITLNDLPEIENSIEDIRINGTSIVENKIANIDLSGLNSDIGHTFTTNVTVGHLPAGTNITSSTSIAEILYNILYSEEPTGNILNIYCGGSENPNAGINGLDHKVEKLNIDIDTLLSQPILCNIKTGNVETEEPEYPTIITTKAVRLIKLQKLQVTDGNLIFDCSYKVIEKDGCFIYYIDTAGYSEDTGGIDYLLTFEEVE